MRARPHPMLESGKGFKWTSGIRGVSERRQRIPDCARLLNIVGSSSSVQAGFIRATSLHVVAALDVTTKTCFIITVYRPDADHFGPDFKTRIKR